MAETAKPNPDYVSKSNGLVHKEIQPVPEIDNPLLIPCHVCGRTFKPESLERHVKICEKTVSKQRKIFDSSKQRLSCLEGVDLPKSPVSRKSVSPVRKRSSESKKSKPDISCRVAVKVSSKQKGKGEATITSRIASVAAQYIKCPHCDRKFNPKAADRHIQWCQEHKFRESINSQVPSTVAKERLEARTKYKAPSPVKRRLSNKWKYSPALQKQRSPSPNNNLKICNAASLGKSSGYAVSTSLKRATRTSRSLRISSTKAIESQNKLNSKSIAQKSLSSLDNKILTKTCSYPSIKSSSTILSKDMKPLSKNIKTLSDCVDYDSTYSLDARTEPEGDEDLSESNFLVNCHTNSLERSRKTKSLEVHGYNPFLSAEKQMELLMNSSWPGAKDFATDKLSPCFPQSQPCISNADPMYGVDPLFSRYLTPSNTYDDSLKSKRSSQSHSQTNIVSGKLSQSKPSSQRDEYWKQFFLNEQALKEVVSENNVLNMNGNSIDRHSGGENHFENNNEKEEDEEDRQSNSSSLGLPVITSASPISPKHHSQESIMDVFSNNNFKLSKFCHECGHKYPVTVAKFCCECGVRRLSLE